MPRRNVQEDRDQKQVIEWAYANHHKWPWCIMSVERRVRKGRSTIPIRVDTVPVIAYPGGGNRSAATGRVLHETGTRKGMLDLQVPVACGKYFGLVIEMKTGKNKITPEQDVMLEWFSKNRWMTAVCYNATEAIFVITQYLNQGLMERCSRNNTKETISDEKN
jgi:hypothetical protein